MGLGVNPPPQRHAWAWELTFPLTKCRLALQRLETD